MNYSAPSLERFAHCALSAYGCDAGEAKIVSEHLVAANLAGHDSHGIGMLPMYGAQIRDGNLIPRDHLDFNAQGAGVGDHLFGVAAWRVEESEHAREIPVTVQVSASDT